MQSLLFTGASGFIGKNIISKLKEKYDVTTLGRSVENDISVNLAENIPCLPHSFDMVLHAAGKAHVVPRSKEEEDSFYSTNFEGTKKLCKALEKVGVPKFFVFISTVAVYGCEKGTLITEDFPRNGASPYAKSKIMAEDFLTEWCKKNNVVLTILRASLIAGKNPPGNLGAMIRGIKSGFYANIGGGNARKSILMADDIVKLIELASLEGGIYNICDNHHPSFGELSKVIATQLGKSEPFSIPIAFAKFLAVCGDILGKKAPFNSSRLEKLTLSLTFSNEKAVSELGWEPLSVLENFQIR